MLIWSLGSPAGLGYGRVGSHAWDLAAKKSSLLSMIRGWGVGDVSARNALWGISQSFDIREYSKMVRKTNNQFKTYFIDKPPTV